MTWRISVIWAVLVVWSSAVWAEVKPHALFSDNAVLQRGVSVPVWGTAKDGEKVTVKFNGQEVSTTAKDGKWMVRLRPLKAGGPFTLTIQGENTIELKNVLVGEVWVCSGQSNMQWPVSASANPQETIANSPDAMLRLFTVPRRAADAPESDVQGNWVVCGPETVPNFSAVAYFFGRDLRKALNVPVGLISTNVGGTPAEAWTSRRVLESDPMLRGYLERHELAVKNYPQALERFKAAEEKAKAEGTPPPRPPANPAQSLQRPCGLYNAMIAPLIPYAIKGVIWYQGESNVGRAYEYRTLFPAMIRNWREDWGLGDFPFLFVQLAPFMQIVNEPQEGAWAELREAQLLTFLKTPKTGMAVITDAGDPNDIHPKQKEPVGARLALAARAIAYGERIVYSGPIYKSMKVEGNKVVLSFDHVGGGLVAKDGDLKGFTIAGEDRKFYNAHAAIKGNTVVVWSPQVERPVAVRYGWANCPVVNLYNKEGLPASPFRTDDFPMVTAPK
ncbi:MAG: sialate O-acetylesterase [Abditibacteriales bacterium]|nr:sialate O-acetylesterase [Abditibacteriales bacterium]MDW8365753.1 sialate O-acetylesterase [Abditibacteriales bacterium]